MEKESEGEKSLVLRAAGLLQPLLIVTFAIFLAEGLIMFLLSFFPHLPQMVEGIVDAAILVILVFPVLYFFIVKPLAENIQKRQKNEVYESVRSAELTQLVVQLDKYAESLRLDVRGAKGILNLLDGEAPAYIELGGGNRLFTFAVSMPCAEEGGDHYFIKELPSADGKNKKTLLSIKDQSGHSVPCLLRSIATDLIHDSIINKNDQTFKSSMLELNKRICNSDIFADGEYFTSICGEIDHNTLMFSYSCNGHPPFFHIREGVVTALPMVGEEGHGMPMVLFEDPDTSVGHLQLQRGDKIIFYTDGLYEMMTVKDGSFGVEELQEVVSTFAEFNLSELVENLMEKMGSLTGETIDPHLGMNSSGDDITVVGIEISEKS